MSNTQIKVVGFVPILKGLPGEIATRAFILCVKCGDPISSSGGPVPGALCLDCAATVLLRACEDEDQPCGQACNGAECRHGRERDGFSCAHPTPEPVTPQPKTARQLDPFGVRRGP